MILTPKVGRRTPSTRKSTFTSFLSLSLIPVSLLDLYLVFNQAPFPSASCLGLSDPKLTSTGNQCPGYPQAQSLWDRHCTRYRTDTEKESPKNKGKLAFSTFAEEADEKGII